MYFLAGKNGIRKLTDYRYRIPGATPTPTGEGEKNLRITGIGSPYEQYNGDYRRDQSAVYATPGTAGQQWTQDGGGGMLTINSAGQWALTMGNVTSNSDKLATAGWPWESVFLWDSMGQTVTMVIAALDDDNPESAWRQIVGDDMICSASGNFQVGDDTHAIILGKDYPVVSVGSDEIAQLWTGENLDIGELGFYYNGDPTVGAVYGSLVGADQATLLDYKLRGVEYNPSIDGRIDFNSFLPAFRSIGTGDFELEIEFELGPFGGSAYIFQMPASNTTACLGVWALTSTDGNALIQSSCMLIGTSYQLLAVPYTTGIHTAEISRAAGVVTIDIDGTSQSWTGDAIDLSTATMLAPYNNADCILHSVKLTSGGVSRWAIDGVPLATPSRYTLPSRAHLDALITLAGGSTIAGKMLKSAGSVNSGGAWANPPAVNFAADNRTWTEYIDTINQQWDLTHQYKLRVKFYLSSLPGAALCVFGNSGAGGPVSLLIEQTGRLRAYTHHYWRSDAQRFASRLTSIALEAGKVYEAEVSTEPTTVRLEILTAGYEYNGIDELGTMPAAERITVSNVISNFPGNLLELEITDMTTGAVIFSPAHADLYHDEVTGVDRFGFAMLPGGLLINGTSQNISQRGLLLGLDPAYAGTRFLDFYYYNAGAALNSAGAANAVAASVRALKTRGELALDGRKIPTVLIGLQSWTAENDRNTEFSTPRNDATLNDIYGPVYDYQQTLERDAALAASGSCWRVPRWDEFQILIDTATGDALKSREGWEANSGKNTSGFNALPGGRTAASLYVGQHSMLGSVTPGSADDTWRALALTSSNQTAASGGGSLVTGFSLRLVKRFYDVLMPWGEMLRFVKIGSLFIAQTNLTYRGQSGTLGRYYNNDSTLSYLGLLYTPAEAEILRKEFRDAGLPFEIPSNTVFISTLAKYNGGTAATQGKKLKAATGWANPDYAGTDDYEFSALPGGERNNTSASFYGLGAFVSFLVRFGAKYSCIRMLGENDKIVGGWQAEADDTVAAAYIRLVYEVS